MNIITRLVGLALASCTVANMLGVGGCLTLCGTGGCFIPVSADRLAGYYAPNAKAEKTWLGASIELGTSFQGTAEYDSTTGSYKVVVDSKPEPVLQAQAERATALENLRQIEASANVEIAKAWSQAMTQSIGALSTALQSVVQAPTSQPASNGLPLDPALIELLTPENVQAILGLLQGNNPAGPGTVEPNP